MKAIKRSMMTLAPGSAFMHASHTETGKLYDVDMNSVIVYTGYQAYMKKIGAENLFSYTLKPGGVGIDARELSEDIALMPLNYPVEKWYSVLKGYERYYNDNAEDIASAMIITILTLALPFWIAKPICNLFANTILKKVEDVQAAEKRVDPEEWPHHWYYTYLLPDLETISKIGRFPILEVFYVMLKLICGLIKTIPAVWF